MKVRLGQLVRCEVIIRCVRILDRVRWVGGVIRAILGIRGELTVPQPVRPCCQAAPVVSLLLGEFAGRYCYHQGVDAFD